MTSTLLTAWLIVAAAFALLWVRAKRRDHAAVVDVAWAFSLGFLGLFYAVFAPGLAERRWLCAALLGAWSVRLGLHLWKRLSHEKEDGRYVTLKQEWGPDPWPKFFRFFQFQALSTVILSLSLVAVLAQPSSALGWNDAAGAIIALGSVLGEALADRQLARFRTNPANKGSTCREGLWRFSRHPNYFFEWTHWLAYVAMSVGSPLWFLSLFSPIALLWLILKVTGIPPTEAQALLSRGDDYRRYQKETNAFFPWFPRR